MQTGDVDTALQQLPQCRQHLPKAVKPGLRRPKSQDIQRNIAGLPASPTCGEALGDLPDADRYPELLDDDETETGAFGKPSA